MNFSIDFDDLVDPSTAVALAAARAELKELIIEFKARCDHVRMVGRRNRQEGIAMKIRDLDPLGEKCWQVQESVAVLEAKLEEEERAQGRNPSVSSP